MCAEMRRNKGVNNGDTHPWGLLPDVFSLCCGGFPARWITLRDATFRVAPQGDPAERGQDRAIGRGGLLRIS